MVQKIRRNQTILKVGKICDKDDILTVQEKRVPLIGNKKKGTLETNPWKIELEARKLKSSTMRIKKRIKKGKIIIVRYWWKKMLQVFTGEASIVYLKK